MMIAQEVKKLVKSQVTVEGTKTKKIPLGVIISSILLMFLRGLELVIGGFLIIIGLYTLNLHSEH